MFLHHWNLLVDCFIWMLRYDAQLLSTQEWKDILEGLVTVRGHPNSRTYKRGARLEERLRPALTACNIASIEGVLPVAPELCPEFSVVETHEIVWQVAETGFCFEFAPWTDGRRARSGWINQLGWAAEKLEDRHLYAQQTARLMLGWKTKTHQPTILERANLSAQWTVVQMESLKHAVCRYYTQVFWEFFGRAAVVPLCLEHDLGKEEGEL
ncbi:hypothetical protein B0H17DRAFT_1220022 [Mycena rosella]|uniref:Uncharacterized protein n=1 Tax=Mycena rosella TaxID=1033263 RepID=A0AAD7BDH0_MYCRO|nr:hypothetical protein B0H17DRAFT_1220019 [Mycena rosella]KAJ7617709.1 hypothetical protein B0H17DRAFT_1220022 [Mycena rosella]